MAALISITFVLSACASLREEQVASEALVVPAAMCAKDGRTVSVKSPPGRTMTCAMEMPVGSHLRDCVCRDEGQVVNSVVAMDPAGKQEISEHVHTN